MTKKPKARPKKRIAPAGKSPIGGKMPKALKKASGPRSARAGRVCSPAEKRFAQEWMIDFNGTQAAIRAGYSPNGADIQAGRMLARPWVQAELAILAAAQEKRLDLSADRTLLEVARIAFADIRKIVEWRSVEVGKVKVPDPNSIDDDGMIEIDITSAQVKLKASDEIDDDTAAAISEIKQGKDGQLTIKMHSKPAALDLLARHHGLLIDRKEILVKHEIEGMTDDELAEYEHRLAERARRARLESSVIEGTGEEIRRERP